MQHPEESSLFEFDGGDAVVPPSPLPDLSKCRTRSNLFGEVHPASAQNVYKTPERSGYFYDDVKVFLDRAPEKAERKYSDVSWGIGLEKKLNIDSENSGHDILSKSIGTLVHLDSVEILDHLDGAHERQPNTASGD